MGVPEVVFIARKKPVIVPIVEIVEKIIDVPVVKQVEIPQVLTVERVVEIPSIETIERIETVPRIQMCEGITRHIDVSTRHRHVMEREVVQTIEDGPDLPLERLEPIIVGMGAPQ